MLNEDEIEKAFWEFDTEHKKSGQERYEFKKQVRKLILQHLSEDKLYELCRNYVKEHHISEPAAICQNDSVIIDAYEFIKKICDIVGYHEYDEDDEDW